MSQSKDYTEQLVRMLGYSNFDDMEPRERQTVSDIALGLPALITTQTNTTIDKIIEIIGEDEDLNAPINREIDLNPESDNPYPDPKLQYVVRRATRNLFREDLVKDINQLRKEL